jgi:adenylosuccinate lyase
MPTNPLAALSPLDGRYRDKVSPLADYFSEFGLIRYRLKVEVAWLKALNGASALPQRPNLPDAIVSSLERAATDFSLADAGEIKAIEAQINHDVKALEYWIKRRLTQAGASRAATEFVHFACTSEDINNLAYSLALRDARAAVVLPALGRLEKKLTELAHRYAAAAMLARTHGQPATPTTMGKELANVVHRIRQARGAFASVELTGKINGAVGNYNAHTVAFPEMDWPLFAQQFVHSLGLAFNPYTIQIEPHDTLAQLFDALARMNTILIDLNRDLWGYISIGYFKQRVRAGEVGSSTMPHKVNPIDFENAEGNLGLANALLRHLSEKLPISRWQRDLTDSTVLRNVGSALGYALLAYESCLRGLEKLDLDEARLAEDLAGNWDVLAEAIQTVMRRFGLENPYEQLKALTRGRDEISCEMLQEFVRGLAIPEPEKLRLLALTPTTYTGLAERLAREI